MCKVLKRRIVSKYKSWPIVIPRSIHKPIFCPILVILFASLSPPNLNNLQGNYTETRPGHSSNYFCFKGIESLPQTLIS